MFDPALFSLIAQVVADSIIAGGILSLVSIGYSLIYGILRFINFAHGDVVTTAALVFLMLFSDLQLPLAAAAIGAIIFTSLLGLAINRFVYKPLRKAHPLQFLVAAIALSFILGALLLIFFGADVRIIKNVNNQFPSEPIEILGAFITPVQLAIIIISLASAIGIELFLSKTKIGKEIRATADNPELATTIGIDTERVIAFAFLLASSLAAIAGIMLSADQPVNFIMGVKLGIRAFAASVIGGIGSIYGAFLGAFFLGFAENIGILFLPSGYKDAIGFFLLILFLLFRPGGILKSETRRI